MHLLDTSVLIEILKTTDAGAKALLEVGNHEIGMSALTRFEILTPLQGEELDEMKLLLKNIPIVNFDASSAEKAAEIDFQLAKEGEKIGIIDTLIAGSVKDKNLTIVTFDKHFTKVPDLKVNLLNF